MRHVHVIGGGLAGLSAAVRLARAGAQVSVFEAAKFPGGRCRSFQDPTLEALIDNGTHLMLSGNSEVLEYLDLIHARDHVSLAPSAAFAFFDAATGQRWTLDLGRGKGRLSLMWSLMASRHRPPGIGLGRLLRDLGALRAGRKGTVKACLGESPAYAPFWSPLTLAVLNTAPETAAAQMLWDVLAHTVLKGGAFARPMWTRQGLGPALVEPALAVLRRHGAHVHLGRRVRMLDIDGGRIVGFTHGGGAEVLAPGDAVILAVPPAVALDLLPGLVVPGETCAILNVHYRVAQDFGPPFLMGLLNAPAHWLFVRGRVVSVTISAADHWMDKTAQTIAHALWPSVVQALGEEEGQGRDEPSPPACRVLKERRATFAQTPEAAIRRPSTRTAYANLFLAGDWTATGLPATIEGALKSGRLAAEAVLAD